MASRYRNNFGRLRGAAGERFYEGQRPTLPTQGQPAPPAEPAPGAPPKPPTANTTQART